MMRLTLGIVPGADSSPPADYPGTRTTLRGSSLLSHPVLRYCLALWLALGLCTDAFPSGAAHLNRALDGVLKREIPANVSVSVQVADLETGQILAEKNPDLPLIPASTMKVVTSSAALSRLKPDFTFVTEVFADKVKGSSVGNLYLKGSGDPYLVSEQLFALTREVRDKGLSEVRGNIVADDSYFIPGEPLDEQEQLGLRSYHAPYSALSLNFNTVRIMVHPGVKPGQPARVFLDPVSEYAALKAGVKTIGEQKPSELAISKECTPSGRDTISVSGFVAVGAATKARYVNVSTPSLYTGEVFKAFLLREGIAVNGSVVLGKVPTTAASYAKFPSQPLGVIVYWLNKFSNNFMAEQISMALGAAVHGAPGTREKGIAVLRDHLLSIGVDESTFSVSEASGLSRNNRLSASALVRCLLAAAREFSYNNEFMASLGIAGADGTLKEKFTDQGAKRRMRAKTGTLRGVNALAGYGKSREGRIFVFAVLVNSANKGAGFIDYGDKIVRSLLDTPLRSTPRREPKP